MAFIVLFHQTPWVLDFVYKHQYRLCQDTTLLIMFHFSSGSSSGSSGGGSGTGGSGDGTGGGGS